MVFFSVAGVATIMTLGVGYVDDVTLGITVLNPVNQIKEATEAVRSIAQHWEKELYTTGGKLELLKCFWILLAWSWRNGQPVLWKKKHDEAELTLIQSESGDKIVITRKDVTNAPKRLGVRVSADGKWKRRR